MGMPTDIMDMNPWDSSAPTLRDAYRSLLPEHEVRAPLLETGDAVGESACAAGWPVLTVPSPAWSAADLSARLRDRASSGVAAHPGLAGAQIPAPEVRISDILPVPHLEALDSLSAVVRLRLPRGGLVQDPLNLAQLLRIEGKYRKLSLIVAGVGGAGDRAGLPDALRRTERCLFDTAAVRDRDAALLLLDGVGPRRLVFAGGLSAEGGEDAPAFHGRIRALREAVEARGLAAADVADIFRDNAERALQAADPAARRPPQLRMVWPPGRRAPRMPRLPEGYLLRTWREGDAEGYRAVMRAAGFDSWAVGDRVPDVLKAALPEGLYFIVHEATGRIVATTVAGHNPIEQHPFGGELGWVAVDPAHRGRKLSVAACAAAVRRFRGAGYAAIYLRTDDFRLPALRIYLDMGFLPLLYREDMEGRWRKVFAELGRDWNTSGAIRP